MIFSLSNQVFFLLATKYFSYEEIVKSLESGAVKYAIFDQYALEPYKQRLSNAGIVVAHTYPNTLGRMGGK